MALPIQMTEGTVIVTRSHRNRTFRHKVGWVARGESGRKVCHGPMVPGPWAYAYGLCTVIDNSGGTGAESARLREAGMEFDVDVGTLLEIDDTVYAVGIRGGGEWVDLAPVAP